MFETSQASSAALEAYRTGAPLPEIVSAFAAETDNSFDDRMAAELTDWLVQAVEGAEKVAQVAVATAAQVSEQTPRQAERLREVVNLAEFHAPDILRQLHDLADRSETLSKEVERMTLVVALGASQLSLLCQQLLRGSGPDENSDL